MKRSAEIGDEESYPNLAKITNKMDYVKQEIFIIYETGSFMARKIKVSEIQRLFWGS